MHKLFDTRGSIYAGGVKRAYGKSSNRRVETDLFKAVIDLYQKTLDTLKMKRDLLLIFAVLTLERLIELE